jgi:hypothetical protein
MVDALIIIAYGYERMNDWVIYRFYDHPFMTQLMACSKKEQICTQIMHIQSNKNIKIYQDIHTTKR